jgi:hypothetical protein
MGSPKRRAPEIPHSSHFHLERIRRALGSDDKLAFGTVSTVSALIHGPWHSWLNRCVRRSGAVGSQALIASADFQRVAFQADFVYQQSQERLAESG